MRNNIFYQNENKILIVFALLVIIIVFYACNHSPFTKAYLSIDQVVDDINKEYINVYGIGYIKSAKVYKYYSQDKIVDLHVKNNTSSESQVDLGIKLNRFNEKKENAIELFQFLIQGLEDKHRVLFDSLSSFKYSARFNIHSSIDTTIAIVTLSSSKIKQALAKERLDDENEFAIQMYCKIGNLLSPIESNNMICDTVYTDQNNINFRYQVDDKVLPFEKVNVQELRALFINEIKDNRILSHNLLWNIYETQRGIRYYYHGINYGKDIIIQLSNEEVKEIYFHQI